MTRMVDEQRTQIGTLKALGYSDGAIAWKYISYSGSAALLGRNLRLYAGDMGLPTGHLAGLLHALPVQQPSALLL